MTDSLFRTDGLTRRFAGVAALDGFACSVTAGEIVGILGPNGAGKTTLFNLVTGFLDPDGGTAQFRGGNLLGLPPHRIARLGVARTFQDLRLVRRLSVLENVLLSFQGQPGEALRNVFFRPAACSRREAANHRAATALLESAGLAGKTDDLADSLSYGQQKLLSLVSCLATGADLLLLDEPVAGIAPEMIQHILSIIRGLPVQGKSVVIIEHNVEALRQVCNRLVFMDAGRKVSDGTADEVLNDPRVIEAYLD